MEELFLVVRGRRNAEEEAEPIFATDDPEILAEVGRLIARRLGVRLPGSLCRVSPRDDEGQDPRRQP